MKLNDLVQSLIIEVPGCPMPTIRDMLRWAQRELCSEGNVWIVNDGPAVVAANTSYAEVEAPQGAEVFASHAAIPGWSRAQAWSLSLGRPVLALLSFWAHHRKASVLTGSVSCRPAYGEDMPDALVSRWSETIMDGARYRLLNLPQPWQNAERAEFHRRLFLDAQSNARTTRCRWHAAWQHSHECTEVRVIQTTKLLVRVSAARRACNGCQRVLHD